MGFPPILLGLAVLFAANRLILPRFSLVAPVFWALNLCDLGAAIWIFVEGFPGMEEQVAVRIGVGVLLLFHIAQNLATRERERVHAELGPAIRRSRLSASRADAETGHGEPPPPAP